AARAVDERIAVTAIVRIEQLAEAGVARRDVGGQRRARRALDERAHDAKAAPRRDLGRARQLPDVDGVDARARRALHRQSLDEARDLVGVAFELDPHALGVVAYAAAEAHRGGQAMHRRAKADALDDPTHADSGANLHDSANRARCVRVNGSFQLRNALQLTGTRRAPH